MPLTLDYNKSELEQLKEYLEKGDIASAIEIVDDLDEMSRNATISRIRSFMLVLMSHLVKRQVEGRTTVSWDISITNALDQIQEGRQSRGTKKPLLSEDELKQKLEGAFNLAVKNASGETLGGSKTHEELLVIVNKDSIIQEALDLIANYQE